MTSLIKRDNNELRYNAIWLLDKQGNPSYYQNLIKNTRAFFYGMKREDLDKELNQKIKELVENQTGMDITHTLLVYKHMQRIKDFTKSRKIGEEETRIYKYMLQAWLDELEKWIFRTAIRIEKEIRFSTPPKQYV